MHFTHGRKPAAVNSVLSSCWCYKNRKALILVNFRNSKQISNIDFGIDCSGTVYYDPERKRVKKFSNLNKLELKLNPLNTCMIEFAEDDGLMTLQ